MKEIPGFPLNHSTVINEIAYVRVKPTPAVPRTLRQEVKSSITFSLKTARLWVRKHLSCAGIEYKAVAVSHRFPTT